MVSGARNVGQLMGNNGMFELERAIENWKNLAAAGESVRSEDVMELVTHLRDHISELSAGGLSEEEAFLVATHRIGSTEELDREFAKTNGTTLWRRRIVWMLCGFFAYKVAGALIMTMASIVSTGVILATSSGMTAAVASTCVSAAGWALLLVLACRQAKKIEAAPLRFSVKTGVFIALVLVAQVGSQAGGVAALRNFIPVESVGEMALWSAYGGWVIKIVLLVSTMAMLWKLNEQNPATAMESESAVRT